MQTFSLLTQKVSIYNIASETSYTLKYSMRLFLAIFKHFEYSGVPNKRTGPIKRTDWPIP